MKNKTVYILGAGFSKEAGAPSQEELVKKILENDDQSLESSQKQFKDFLTNTLLIPEKSLNDIPLEDIFTPLDRCIADNISFRNLDIKEVVKIRELVSYLIGKTMGKILGERREKEDDYINLFANSIITKASNRKKHNYRNEDPVSVISTNWDILLDNAIKSELEKKHRKEGVVDYCCHISSYESGDESIKPGLEILGRGGFNVKLLKLHGSLNWLHCPRCLRIYVAFQEKIAIDISPYTHPVKCRHCDKNFGDHDSHILVSHLIMPTFLKNLSNPQYKLIWQNAGIELSEANKIVFIGYSLPQADFEMRQLLSRMIRKDVEIEVVDYSKNKSKHQKETKKRYETFFGNSTRKLNFHWKGAKYYIENNLKNNDLK